MRISRPVPERLFLIYKPRQQSKMWDNIVSLALSSSSSLTYSIRTAQWRGSLEIPVFQTNHIPAAALAELISSMMMMMHPRPPPPKKVLTGPRRHGVSCVPVNDISDQSL